MRRRASSRPTQESDENRELRARRATQLEPALDLPAALESLPNRPRRRVTRLTREDGKDAERFFSGREQALEQEQRGGAVPPLDGPRQLEDLVGAMLAHHRADLGRSRRPRGGIGPARERGLAQFPHEGGGI